MDEVLAAIYARLTAAVGDDVAVSPSAVGSREKIFKYVVYSVLSSDNERLLVSDGLIKARVSIACWAASYTDAADLAQTIKDTLDNHVLLDDVGRLLDYRFEQEVDETTQDRSNKLIYGRNLTYEFMLN